MNDNFELPFEGSTSMEHLPQWILDLLDSTVSNGDNIPCAARSKPVGLFMCTRTEGHDGPHVAHGSYTVAVWED